MLAFFALAAVAPSQSRDEQQVMVLQRSLAAAVDRHDRAALMRGIADGYREVYRIAEGRKVRWGEIYKARLIDRWTRPTPGALRTLVTRQSAVAAGSGATVFACIIDRYRNRAGKEHRDYSRVADSFARMSGEWKWIASMEVQVGAC